MNEETIFALALEKNADERAAFLDEACSQDSALRQRVAALLESHEHSRFLGTPVVNLAAEALGVEETGAPGQFESPDDDGTNSGLDFLAPSGTPDSLGRLGHYDIQEVIGRGGMGIVLRAFDERLHRVVAIKVMAAQLATSTVARKRFTREAQAVAAVSHEHVVTIHAVEEAHGRPYIVMHYVAGLSLEQRLQRNGPLELQEILRIGMQTAMGLVAAHAQGLIHRDIKPANILLENGVERVKITDFGLARAAADASLTQSGAIAGTPHYMAPEQARGDALDARTDLFSLGSVLYAMCTGHSPFRARGNMAVLKRVCEESPTPIREFNPEIPEWVVSIIERLHAKDPADRFQSAAEVAELLGRHLAHVQHPSVGLPPDNIAAFSPGKRLSNRESVQSTPRHRWAMVATGLLFCVFAGLSMTEATGVTQIRATVIRIFTPDGTLIVEVDDPRVKVTIEGDGGLIITGAGLDEIRLRPGNYKLHAERDGKSVPLERDLVTISNGDRKVVKVKLEAPPAAVSTQAQSGAFTLWAGGREYDFDSLAEAVQRASDGETIEIRGNGPFVVDPITTRQALTIRAGDGYRPVLRQSEESVYYRQMFEVKSSLVLEGLVLESVALRPDTDDWKSLVSQSMSGGSLMAANCRFFKLTNGTCIFVEGSGAHVLRNCEFVTPQTNWSIQFWTPSTDAIYEVENCCLTSTLAVASRDTDVRNATVHLRHNTMLGRTCVYVPIHTLPKPEETEAFSPSITIEAEHNVFHPATNSPVFQADYKGDSPLQPAELAVLIPRLATWQSTKNLYQAERTLMEASVKFDRSAAVSVGDLAASSHFWGRTDSDSLQAPFRLKGGEIFNGEYFSPPGIQAEEFRLDPSSRGYRAGPDGKDLGADVDLVGPGAAYERWKKTPEYQRWLKDTGQER